MNTGIKVQLSKLIKEHALSLGFAFCGISKSEFLEDEARNLENWLIKKHHGEMDYMARNFDLRLNPSLLHHGTKSVISVMYNYYTEKKQEQPDAPKISIYAYGRDYHKVVKNKLNILLNFIKQEVGNVSARCMVDSAPILDKAWAVKSGLGWVGKNGNVISKRAGSFFFIGELLIDINLEYDNPVQSHCGNCSACIDACPTGAIIKPAVIDGSKCISYLTIELKNAIPLEFSQQMNNWAFGCDICQNVCPWNRFSIQHKEKDFEPKEDFLRLSVKQWKYLDQKYFDDLFSGTPVKRAGYKGLMRNIKYLE